MAKNANSETTDLPTDSLRIVEWKRFLRAPDAQLVDDLYVPALSRAVRYDRCCGYFSSRVLAVAARGFGGFIKTILDQGDALPKPAARLIINEQLDPADLKALLTTGDQAPLIQKLLKRFKSPADALEKNRLEMLAWLVAEGWLEVRVGLMRHTQGIAHAKFGIVADRHGERVAYMGSDNETGEALASNYEELEIRASWQDEEFVDYYQGRFEALWEDRDVSVTTLPLPDAVRLKIIQYAPKAPPSKELRGDQPTLSAAILWHYLAAAPYLPNGEYACDATALVDLWPHQRQVVEDTARAFPAGRLLCDEVGMGKTIEAILILRRLRCGRGVKRVLLLVPAGLLTQWQAELREKGGLLVPVWDGNVLYQPNGQKQPMEAMQALANHDMLLLSREWARMENNRDLVLTAPAWDLVLMDESHAARRREGETSFNSANLLLQLLRDLQLRRQARGILLLSATPMQTQPWEPWDLLGVAGVGGEWLVEFGDIRDYYGGIAALEEGQIDPDIARAIARLVAHDREFPPAPDGLASSDPAALADGLLFTFGEDGKRAAEWLRKGSPLGQRMHRNTRTTLRRYYERGLLPHAPPRRVVEDVVYDYDDPAERECYDAVAHYIHARYEQLESEKAGKGFLMTIYHRRAASSPLALRRSLERRLEAVDRVIRKQWADELLTPDVEGVDLRDLSEADLDERIDPALPTSVKAAEAEKKEILSLLQRLNALGPTDSKFTRFLSALRDATADGRAVLVFTEYTDTMEYLRDLLCPTYGPLLGCYSGAGGQVWSGTEWTAVTKAEITERLEKGQLQVLVCTDAASEGLNLQTAGALINQSLSWNPSRIEQRIGRIDRIGQKHPELPIINLFLKDSVDMRVYQVLRERCHLFEHFVGEMQPVLSLARDALKRIPKAGEVNSIVQALRQKASEAAGDTVVASVYSVSDPVEVSVPAPPVTRADLETALQWLSEAKGGLTATPAKGGGVWSLRQSGKPAIEVTTHREALEERSEVLPLTLGGEALGLIVERLPLPLSRSPLIIGEYAAGNYRATEARWIDAKGKTHPVPSAAQLLKRLKEWDGSAPLPNLILKAEREAQGAARARVEALMTEDQCEEEETIQDQASAARSRLMRELARTLRCLGGGDLGALFRAELQKEARPDGRFHRALAALGAFPVWDAGETEEANAFVSLASQRERSARVNLGMEIEAALNDPRWRVSRAT